MTITGSGTSADPYIIYTLDDLALIGTSPYTLNKYFKLNNDIDASPTQDPGYNGGAGWIPLGTLTGQFDGNSKRISGLFINSTKATGVGLFGGINGYVHHLILENPDITGIAEVGGIAGNASTAFTLRNCSIIGGSITGSGNYVGSILGRYDNGTSRGLDGFTYNSSTATVTGVNYVGGLFGQMKNVGVNNCNYNGTVNGTTYVGLIGGEYGYPGVATLTLSYVEGVINATGNAIGGLVGNVLYGTKITEITVNNITFNTSNCNYVGGLVGNWVNGQSYYSKLSNCSFTGTVNGNDYVGGIVGWTGRCLIFGLNFNGVVNGHSSVGGIVGFYGYSSNSLTLSYAEGVINATGNNIGGIVGQLNYVTTIDGITVDNIIINASETSDYVGGVVGLYTSAGNQTVKNCIVTIDVTGRDYVGGIVGYSRGTVQDNNYEGTVTGRNNVGGLCGYAYAGLQSGGTIKGVINATGNNIGGIIGYQYYTGTVSGFIVDSIVINASETSDNVGGIVGYFGTASATLQNCECYIDVEGRDSVGGIVGYAQGITITNNIYKNGTVKGRTGVGGIAGNVYSCTFNDGLVENAIISGSGDSIGGFIGYQYYGTTINIPSVRVCNISGVNYVGGILGRGNPGGAGTRNLTSGKAEKVIVTGTDRVGGIAGDGSKFNYILCVSTGTVTGHQYVGGIAGIVTAGCIDRCYSTCDIIGISGSSYVGGIAGYLEASVSPYCVNTYAMCEVSGGDRVGGFAGEYRTYNISYCYSQGLVTGSTNVGGFAGLKVGTPVVTSVYWDKETSTQLTSAVGEGKTTEEMNTQSTYIDFDFTTPIWVIDLTNQRYPWLYDNPLLFVPLSPTGIPSAIEFGIPKISTLIRMEGIDETIQVGILKTIMEVVLQGQGIKLLDFGNLKTIMEVRIIDGGIPSEGIMGIPNILFKISPEGIDSSITVGLVTLIWDQFIKPNGLDSLISFGELVTYIRYWKENVEFTLRQSRTNFTQDGGDVRFILETPDTEFQLKEPTTRFELLQPRAGAKLKSQTIFELRK